MDIVVDELFDETVRNFQKESWINVTELAETDQGSHTIDCFVELECFYTEENEIVPNFISFSIDFQCLLAARDCLEVLLLGHIAVGDVSPGLNFSIIDRNHCTKCVACILEFLHSHVGTAHSEPCFGIELIDS